MNTLEISVENNLVIGRFNGEGEGSVICSYTSEQQVSNIIIANNESENANPSARNPLAVRV